MLRKINELIKDFQKTPYKRKGKPEPLKYDLAGLWLRRIDREHRFIRLMRIRSWYTVVDSIMTSNNIRGLWC